MKQPTYAEANDAKARAIAQFRQWAADPAVIVVDTETTALDGQVWELAAVRVAPAPAPAPVLSFVCSPNSPWSERARKMHADRLEEIAHAPIAALFAAPLGGLLRENRVLTYNAEFDAAAIARTWPDLRLPAFACVMTAYAPLAGKWSESRGAWKYVSLSEALERERVDVRGLPEHTAYGDAARAALLVQAVAARETDAEREHREWIDHAERMATERGDDLP